MLVVVRFEKTFIVPQKVADAVGFYYEKISNRVGQRYGNAEILGEGCYLDDEVYTKYNEDGTEGVFSIDGDVSVGKYYVYEYPENYVKKTVYAEISDQQQVVDVEKLAANYSTLPSYKVIRVVGAK